MSTFDPSRSPVDVERLLAERNWIQRLARSLVADPNAADDVAQDAWLAAIEHPPRHDGNLRSWLAGLVRNTVSASRRREQRRTTREGATQRREDEPSAADAVSRAELARTLVDAVLALDKPRREALALVYFEGLAPNVAADRLGIPHSTLRTHVRRGLAEVREKLERKRGRESWLPALTVLACRPEVQVAGVTLMNAKLVTALAAALILLALGYWRSVESKVTEESAQTMHAVPTELAPAPSIEASAPMAEPFTTRQAAVTTAQPAKSTLIVVTKWAASGLVAAHVPVLVQWQDERGLRGERQGRTDFEGRATFEGLEPRWVSTTTARGHGEGVVLAPSETSIVEVVLPADVHVRGRVVGASDEPIFGALVFGGFFSPPFDEPLCTTDGDGRFDAGWMSRECIVYAIHPEFGRSWALALRETPADVVDIVLRVRGRGGEIAGRIVREDGSGIAGADVTVLALENRPQVPIDGARIESAPYPRARSASDGTFQLRGLPPVKHLVQVRCAGNGAREVSAPTSDSAGSPLVITLAPGLEVHGTVRDASGAVVQKATVLLLEPHDQRTTDESGRFRFGDVPPGARRFQVRGARAGLVFGTVEFPAATTFEWNPTVDRGRILAGRVVDSKDAPLANWWVRSGPMDNSIPPDEFELMMITDGASARTDADGKFEFVNCTKQARRLNVSPPNIDRNGLAVLTVENAVPGTTDLVLRVDTSKLATAEVRGTIVDEKGNPIGDADISLSRSIDHLSQGVHARSQAGTGGFVLNGVSGNTYELRVRAKNFCDHKEEITIDDSALSLEPIRLVRGGSLVVKLSPEDAALVGRFGIELRVQGTSRDLAFYGEEARIDDLEPGPGTVDSIRRFPRMVPGPSVPFVIKAGETRRVELGLAHLRDEK
ncbi:MAG: sigma-70 family RNA polymerase sigma factor [Planctomycetota bacterium]|nr:sigma-70 family RNA polymerase sigma factor [Planctomycetota bacterium]